MGKTTEISVAQNTNKSKLALFAELAKVRLSFLVVFSAVMAFMLGWTGIIDWTKILWLVSGGFFITAASNTINQIIEKDLDKLMSRTKGRPLPTGQLSLVEAAIFAGTTGILGIFILSYFFNPLSGVLGALSLISYAFIYTPSKRLSPISVFVGAIPGSMPLLIGWTAATGAISIEGVVLFGIQFFWQIPHFWSIAWLLNEDYEKAGFKLLPSSNGKTRMTALQNIPYLLMLILSGTFPYVLGMAGKASLLISLIAGFYFLFQGVQLTIDTKDKSARRLMFASFIYLPVVFLAYVIDKI